MNIRTTNNIWHCFVISSLSILHFDFLLLHSDFLLGLEACYEMQMSQCKEQSLELLPQANPKKFTDYHSSQTKLLEPLYG